MNDEEMEPSLRDAIEEALDCLKEHYSNEAVDDAINQLNYISESYEAAKSFPTFLLSFLLRTSSRLGSKSRLDPRDVGDSETECQSPSKSVSDGYVELPTFARFLLNLVISKEQDYVIGDICEDYAREVEEYGASRAYYRLSVQVVLSIGFIGGMRIKQEITVRVASWFKGTSR